MDHLNAFEIAVLERIAEVHPQYQAQLRELCASGQISGRDWNGHGGFINFAPNPVTFDPPNIELHPQAEISLQSLKHGIGAILFVRSGKAEWLEVFAYDEEWWGDLTGFKIVPNIGQDAA